MMRSSSFPFAPVFAVLLLFTACDPPVETFDFTLNLNIGGDDTLLSDLDFLEVDMVYADETTTTRWDWFEDNTLLRIDEVPPDEEVYFEVRGWIGSEEVAFGQSEPVTMIDGEQTWVLFHRHGIFIDLEGGDVPRLGHKVFAVDGGAIIYGGLLEEGVYAPISKLVRTENAGYALEEVADGPELWGFAATTIHGGDLAGQIFVAGGAPEMSGNMSFGGFSDLYTIWDPATESYTEEDGTLEEAKFLGQVVSLSDASAGQLVLVGGLEEDLGDGVAPSRRIETIDPYYGDAETLSTDVYWHHPTVAWGPDVAITCGGWDLSNQGMLVVRDTCSEFFASSNEEEVHEGVLSAARAGHGATTIGATDDKILLVGGTTSSDIAGVLPMYDWDDDVLDTAEIIDPGQGFSAGTIQMVEARLFPAVVRIPDTDLVLVCGGHDGTSLLSSCETYNELTGNFAAAPELDLGVPANNVQAVALDDGSVLFVGGNRGDNEAVNLVKLYLP